MSSWTVNGNVPTPSLVSLVSSSRPGSGYVSVNVHVTVSPATRLIDTFRRARVAVATLPSLGRARQARQRPAGRHDLGDRPRMVGGRSAARKKVADASRAVPDLERNLIARVGDVALERERLVAFAGPSRALVIVIVPLVGGGVHVVGEAVDVLALSGNWIYSTLSPFKLSVAQRSAPKRTGPGTAR